MERNFLFVRHNLRPYKIIDLNKYFDTYMFVV